MTEKGEGADTPPSLTLVGAMTSTPSANADLDVLVEGDSHESNSEAELRYQHILSSANRLLTSGEIDVAEYKQLIASDFKFQKELVVETEVEIKNKVENSFGECWGDKKERTLRYHAANMPVGIIVGTLHSRVRESMLQEEREREAKEQALLATPRTQGLGLLSPVRDPPTPASVTPPPPPPSAEVMLRDSTPGKVSADPDSGVAGLRIVSQNTNSALPSTPASAPLAHRRRMSASRPTGLEEWVDSANAGAGGGFDFDNENDRSRSSSIAQSEPGSSLSNPPSLLHLYTSGATSTTNTDSTSPAPGTSPVNDSMVHKKTSTSIPPERRDRADSALSVTPTTTTWTEINSEEARKQQRVGQLSPSSAAYMGSYKGSFGSDKVLSLRDTGFGSSSSSSSTDDGEEEGEDRSHDYPRVDMRSFIVKSNDDLRQEMVVLQLMRLCKEIWHDFGLDSQLFLRPYTIQCTSSTTGVVEVIHDSMSIDALKKTDDFKGLPAYFRDTYGGSPEMLHIATSNFTRSLAAYSIFTYLLLIKDRHNGNILIGRQGHLMHIDFGFLLGIAPGGAFSLETAPFKLTEEYVEVMGGLESPMFTQFVRSFTTGMLALRTNAENIISTLEILSKESPFPCFAGKDVPAIMERLKGRFRAELSTKEFAQHCLDLIIASYSHYGTRQYDNFQFFSNGILV